MTQLYEVREGHTYEIREDHASYYYPFTVYEDGVSLERHFSSRDGGEIWIGTGGDVMDLVLFNDFDDHSGTDTLMDPDSEDGRLYAKQKAFWDQWSASHPAKPVEVKVPAKKVVFYDGPYEVGAIITDKDGKYRVTEKSHWLPEAEVAEMEEAFDVFDVQSGWQTPAELIEEAQ